jgi:curved DNA-binding protein CbpA
MQVKDYYTILGLQPSATLPEIKKAYHRLALQYHPDKNNNDPYAAVQFTEIKEAYEVLTNPAKKEYYLQQRWYNRSMGKKMAGKEPVSPPTLLKQCLELNKYVASLDTYRMDKEGLAQYIGHILSDSNIEQLQSFNEPDVNRQIIITVVQTITPLRLSQIRPVTLQLFKLAGADTESKNLVAAVLEKHRKKEKLEKYQPFIIVLVTVIICLVIYWVSR